MRGVTSGERQNNASPSISDQIWPPTAAFMLSTVVVSAQQAPQYPLDDKLANEPAPWTVPGKWGKRGNWGRWGEDDKRGMLNYITPEMVAQAASLVKRGKVYALGEELTNDVPRVITPARVGIQIIQEADGYDRVGAKSGEFDPKRQQGAASFTFMHNHTGTHLDTFGHIYRENSLFNNMPPPKPSGTVQGDAASVVQMVGRGVLLDVAAYKGSDPLPVDYWISHRGPAEHREGAERRDPQGRYPAGPHGMAEDVERTGQRRASRCRAHQVASAATRHRPRLPEVPERDGDRRHRLGQRRGGVGLPGESPVHAERHSAFSVCRCMSISSGTAAPTSSRSSTSTSSPRTRPMSSSSRLARCC